MQRLIAAHRQVLVDIAGVYVAGVSQRDAVFQYAHGMLVQVRDAFRRNLSGGIRVAQISQSQGGHRVALAQMDGDDPVYRLGGHVGIEDSGAVGKLDVQQWLGETEAQAAHAANIGFHPMTFHG